MANIDISFVIPAYNAEKFLRKSVESIIDFVADFNFEILIINDGSTDKTAEVAKELSLNFHNIRIISSTNMGVSHARNLGIFNSKGKYLYFFDADDFVFDSSINEVLKKALSTCVDIIRSKYVVFDGRNYNRDVCQIPHDLINKELTGIDYLFECIRSNSVEVVPWLGLFKKDFLVSNNIYFPEGIGYEEDQLFYLEALLVNNSKVIQTDYEYYAYNSSSNGVTKRPTYRQALDVLEVVRREINLIHNKSLNGCYVKCAYKYISKSFFQLTSICGRIDKSEYLKIRGMIDKQTRRVVIKNADSVRNRLKYFCFFEFPSLYRCFF